MLQSLKLSATDNKNQNSGLAKFSSNEHKQMDNSVFFRMNTDKMDRIILTRINKKTRDDQETEREREREEKTNRHTLDIFSCWAFFQE